MRRIGLSERKRILEDLLQYFDSFCKEKGINYTLLGGSLIGAIRHKGFIPWDDDVDVILLPDDYEKLLSVIDTDKKSKYRFINPEISKSYPYPFVKLVNADTVLYEDSVRMIEDYGIYLDVFSYHYVSRNKVFRAFHYHYLNIVKMLLGIKSLDFGKLLKNKDYLRLFVHLILGIIPTNKLKKTYINACKKKKKTEYLLSNWPAYGLKKEIQKVEFFDSFCDCVFENTTAMICSRYDDMLKNTFGDYMKLPPIDQRKSNHSDKAYWRDEEDEKK